MVEPRAVHPDFQFSQIEIFSNWFNRTSPIDRQRLNQGQFTAISLLESVVEPGAVPPFASVHPDEPNRFERMVEPGAVHPDFQFSQIEIGSTTRVHSIASG